MGDCIGGGGNKRRKTELQLPLMGGGRVGGVARRARDIVSSVTAAVFLFTGLFY